MSTEKGPTQNPASKAKGSHPTSASKEKVVIPVVGGEDEDNNQRQCALAAAYEEVASQQFVSDLGDGELCYGSARDHRNPQRTQRV